jgi:hypothetical protein
LVIDVVMALSIGTWIVLGLGGVVVFHVWKNVVSIGASKCATHRRVWASQRMVE